jgi:hypothetical protein
MDTSLLTRRNGTSPLWYKHQKSRKGNILPATWPQQKTLNSEALLVKDVGLGGGST